MHLVMVTVHTSPIASPGAADAGGMNVVVLNSALALARLGHRVDLVTRRTDAAQPDVVNLAVGLRLIHLDAGPCTVVAKSEAESLIDPFRAEMGRWLAASGNDVDIIHSHHWFSGVAAIPLAREAGIKHLQSYHSVAAPEGASLEQGEQPESAGRAEGERFIALHSDRIVAVSQAERATILHRYQPAPEQISVVHPGVDLDLFHPETSPAPERDDYLLFAARLQPLKAPDLAIELLAQIPEARRPRLVIAGEASRDFAHYERDLRALAHRLDVAQLVEFAGSQQRDAFAQLLRRARILLNTSQSETYGLVNLEAAASGVPVVARSTGGMLESVRDAHTGVLVAGAEPAQWAQAVQRLLEAPDSYAAMRRAGREFAQQRSWDVVAQELTEVYRKELQRA